MHELPVFVRGELPRVYWMQTPELSDTGQDQLVARRQRLSNGPLKSQEMMHQLVEERLPLLQNDRVPGMFHDQETAKKDYRLSQSRLHRVKEDQTIPQVSLQLQMKRKSLQYTSTYPLKKVLKRDRDIKMQVLKLPMNDRAVEREWIGKEISL